MSRRRHARDPRWPRDFHHRRTAGLLSPRQAWELLRSFPSQAERNAARVPVTPAEPLPPTGPGGIAVTWLGHASALLRVDGVTLLVDPVLAGGIPGARRRLTPPPLAPEQLPPLDAVLISHDHYDHLDAPTLRRLPRATPVLVGAGSAPWFVRRGFTDVTELDWWESVPVGSTRVEFVPAHHWSRRTPFDTCRRLWGGWVVTAADGRSVLHAGDTGYGPFHARVGARHRDIAVALLPVGAYAPRRLLRGVHMDPAEAVRAAADLGARRVVPVHWGTFVLSGEPILEPLEGVRAAWARAGRDRDDLWDLPVGGTGVL
ncbi:MBL fold metallo-hydrolase [Actinomycetospora cinnamomea]|uniref:L-ascorbate metabolism protein UlaG (Beta-lactamase superfamily) n=1 Tax=Actinomycetospora cinnamomea TaxID=663609 RepID=A0A2U1EUR3_9PSEU|nr:MBL fold metallo-hydrolase [Actinomycetospora cinnamomea]PVZ03674.1 L-ascorbate metabolism protein UlaG (beta-lactamase superfamily) [Actinomycetospora cinnamomea]